MPAGRVAYARDAFDGLALMDRIVGNDFDGHLAEVQRKSAGRPVNRARKLGRAADAQADAAGRCRGDPPAPGRADPRRAGAAAALLGAAHDRAGAGQGASCPISTSACSTNSSGAIARTAARSAEYKEWAKKELRPVLHAHRSTSRSARRSCVPQAAYGYWRVRRRRQRRDPVRRRTASASSRASRSRGRTRRAGCASPISSAMSTSAERDVIGLQVVTMGRRASEAAREWFAENRYQDYLYLHGLSVEMAEALAEYVHKRIRGELGFAAEEARDHDAMLAARLSRQPLFASATRPARTSPTSGICWTCSAPTRSASPSARKTSSTPSNRPRRSSSTTRRRSTFRCEAVRQRAIRPIRADRPQTFTADEVVFRSWQAGQKRGIR